MREQHRRPSRKLRDDADLALFGPEGPRLLVRQPVERATFDDLQAGRQVVRAWPARHRRAEPARSSPSRFVASRDSILHLALLRDHVRQLPQHSRITRRLPNASSQMVMPDRYGRLAGQSRWSAKKSADWRIAAGRSILYDLARRNTPRGRRRVTPTDPAALVFLERETTMPARTLFQRSDRPGRGATAPPIARTRPDMPRARAGREQRFDSERPIWDRFTPAAAAGDPLDDSRWSP